MGKYLSNLKELSRFQMGFLISLMSNKLFAYYYSRLGRSTSIICLPLIFHWFTRLRMLIEILQVENSNGAGQQCDDASSYCGLQNAKYPDSRSMGYPFDRNPREGVTTLQQFLTPNMITQDVRIRFSNRVVAPFQKSSKPNKQRKKPWWQRQVQE